MAIYHVSCLPVIQSAIEQGRLKVMDVLNELNTTRLEVEEPELLTNANTPEDWAAIEARDFSAAERLHYIEFRHVYKTFDHPVLVDVNFHLDAGQTLAIIGRSGVGKSVSLGHIMGFIKPDQGRLFVSYQDITDFTEAQMRQIRKKVTMVFQSGALFDSLTVAENILFSLELRDDYNEQNKEDVVAGLLRIVELEKFADAYPTDLSTGYKRAVAIARALAAQPECILYDEPTTMVDPIMSDHIGNLMLRLKHDLRLTSVVVTHDLDLMRKVADSVVFLSEGKAIYFGPVSELENSGDPHIKEFLAMDQVKL
jgi:phospholipid/cholesterol/gamma-HCH transport system ATP-binding protein